MFISRRVALTADCHQVVRRILHDTANSGGIEADFFHQPPPNPPTVMSSSAEPPQHGKRHF
jgi:hypothetical protein